MIVRHSLFYIVARFLPGVLGMTTTALLTRFLTPEQYGVYGFALLVMTFTAGMGFDWLGISFMRFYEARQNDPAFLATILRLFVTTIVLLSIPTALVWVFGGVLGTSPAIFTLGIVMAVFYAWFELAARYEVANFRPMQYLKMNVGRAAVAMAGCVTAAAVTHNPMWTACGLLLGTAAGAMLGDRAWSKVNWRAVDPKLTSQILAFGLPYAASLTLAAFVNSGTRAMVQGFGSLEALGYFTAAFLLIQNTLVIIATGLGSATYPVAVRAVESGNRREAEAQLRRNGALVLAVMAPAALGMALTGPSLAATLVGPAFAEPVAQLTPWMTLAAFLSTVRANYLDHAFQLGHRPFRQVWVSGAAALVVMGTGFYLIPAEGPLGAAKAMTLGMAAAFVLGLVLMRRAYPMPLPIAEGARVLAACLVMALAVRMLPGVGPWWLAGQVTIGCASYALAGLGLNLLASRDALWAWTRRLAL